MGDPESKRKRYCLMCNVFKPDRCHHCSACNKCVLNMDHHCPWVNNCIGFWNRKFFLLLLFYTVSTLYYYIGTMAPNFIDTIYWHMQAYQKPDIDFVELAIVFVLDVVYVFIVALAFILTKFAAFHVELVLKNMTTIETLEHKSTTYENPVRSLIHIHICIVRCRLGTELVPGLRPEPCDVVRPCLRKVREARRDGSELAAKAWQLLCG